MSLVAAVIRVDAVPPPSFVLRTVRSRPSYASEGCASAVRIHRLSATTQSVIAVTISWRIVIVAGVPARRRPVQLRLNQKGMAIFLKQCVVRKRTKALSEVGKQYERAHSHGAEQEKLRAS